jgi:hypothetical protein
MPATRKRPRTMRTHKPLLLSLLRTRPPTLPAVSPRDTSHRRVHVERGIPEWRVVVVFARAPALGPVCVCVVVVWLASVCEVKGVGELGKGALDRETMMVS